MGCENMVKTLMNTAHDLLINTAFGMGMCWSGYLSTHTAMLDTLGDRNITSRALISHTVGGICAGIAAHYMYCIFY
jgi:hypothetical protein